MYVCIYVFIWSIILSGSTAFTVSMSCLAIDCKHSWHTPSFYYLFLSAKYDSR